MDNTKINTVRMQLVKDEIVSSYNFDAMRIEERESAFSFNHLCVIVRQEYYNQPAEIRQKYSCAEWAKNVYLRDVILDMKTCSYDILSDLCGKAVDFEEYQNISSPKLSLIKKAFYFISPYIDRAFMEFDEI